MPDERTLIGRVTRCSTRGFVGAVRLPEPDLPVFGSFCKAEAQHGQSQVVGLIYDISIEDDELARQLATAENLPPEQLADSQRNRQVPVEYSALAVGYLNGGEFVQRVPPQPPLTLAPILALTPEEVRQFTARLDFLPLVLSAPNLPTDDLLAAALQRAASCRPEHERRPFLLEAGQACARLLSFDLTRLETLLRNIQP
jgi:hypothetical protein